MKRWLRTRLLIVLIALALIPAATLPFANRLRDEWTRFWEPKPAIEEPELPTVERITVTVRARSYGRVYIDSGNAPESAPSPLRFSEEAELGEMAGALRSIDLPTGRPE